MLLAASLTTGVFASSGVTVAPNPQAGNILVDDHGMTLYRYTPDQPNSSTCYDGCARAWPPVLVDTVPTVQDATLAVRPLAIDRCGRCDPARSPHSDLILIFTALAG